MIFMLNSKKFVILLIDEIKNTFLFIVKHQESIIKCNFNKGFNIYLEIFKIFNKYAINKNMP